jgi:DNA modification methylase
MEGNAMSERLLAPRADHEGVVGRLEDAGNDVEDAERALAGHDALGDDAPLTSREAKVLGSLTRLPATVESIAAGTGLGTSSARRVVKSLVNRLLAVVHPDGRYSLPMAVAQSTALGRRGDVHHERFALLLGDGEDRLLGIPSGCVDLIVTSPPFYKKRDYWAPDQLGWEPTPELYLERLLDHMTQWGRIMAPHALAFVEFDDTRPGHGEAPLRLGEKLMVGLDRTGLEKFHEVIWNKTATFPNGNDRVFSHTHSKIYVLRRRDGVHYWDAFMARQEAKGGDMRRMTDVWDIGPGPHFEAKGEHYATFPVELVRRCLDIAMSSKGYCSACGAPWNRITSRDETAWQRFGSPVGRYRERDGKRRDSTVRDESGKVPDLVAAKMEHVGWEPGCRCGAPVRRGVVADPFCGSGTTGVESVDAGHDFLGVDVSDTFLGIANTAMLRRLASG